MKKQTLADMRLSANMDGPNYCVTGKPSYDKKGAITAKNARFRKDHVLLRIYPCGKCGGWHLTSSVKIH